MSIRPLPRYTPGAYFMSSLGSRSQFNVSCASAADAHRDRVNAKVMKDPRLAKMMNPKAMPFDVKRMVYGGFKVLVDL
jgi:hypothetical protein